MKMCIGRHLRSSIYVYYIFHLRPALPSTEVDTRVNHILCTAFAKSYALNVPATPFTAAFPYFIRSRATWTGPATASRINNASMRIGLIILREFIR